MVTVPVPKLSSPHPGNPLGVVFASSMFDFDFLKF
jgi:hypothetical protein